MEGSPDHDDVPDPAHDDLIGERRPGSHAGGGAGGVETRTAGEVQIGAGRRSRCSSSYVAWNRALGTRLRRAKTSSVATTSGRSASTKSREIAPVIGDSS